MSKFLIRRVLSGVKFDLIADNGQPVLSSEVYTTEAACRRGIASIVKNAAIARLEDQTGAAAAQSHPKFELYQDRAGAFRFRLKARNGEVIGVSEGYATKAGCRRGIESVRKNASRAEIAVKPAME